MCLNNCINPNLHRGEGGRFITFCQRITVSPEPHIRLTSENSINLRLSIGVQQEKTGGSICPGLIIAARQSFEAAFFNEQNGDFWLIFAKIAHFLEFTKPVKKLNLGGK